MLRNEDLEILNRKIDQEISYLTVLSLAEEAFQQMQLLFLVNQAEDSSSELAGFEINKLLQQQRSLEREYDQLV